MNKYVIIFKVFDEYRNSTYSKMNIEAISFEDAKSKFDDIWQDEDIVMMDIKKIQP
jgi:hypothetical protein